MTLRSTKLPGTRYQSQCPNCGWFTSFVVFSSSFSDFSTFVGSRSGTLYRLSLTLQRYTETNAEDLLAQVSREEESVGGQLLELPGSVPCSSCRRVFSGSVDIQGEEVIVEAVALDPTQK